MHAASMRRWGWGAVGVLVLVLSLSLSPGEAVASDQTTFSGRATVLRATALGQSIVLADTGPVPPEGGALETSLLEAEVPGLLQAQVLHASSVGRGSRASSEASVANLRLTAGGNTVTASFLRAEAAATCRDGQASASGGSEIAELAVDGQAVTVSGEPNQTITLPAGLTIVINEQSGGASGTFAEITVNALHVRLDGVADVVVSSAHADIRCAGPRPCDRDFTTGGGWITTAPGARGSFGVAGGLKSGAPWGHLLFIDHGRGMKVQGTSVTAYVVVDDLTRRVEGTAKVNGQDGYAYRVDLADRGEPGRSDTLSISLSNGYAASGALGGGNLQLHTCRR